MLRPLWKYSLRQPRLCQRPLGRALTAAASAEEAFHGSNLHPYTEADIIASRQTMTMSQPPSLLGSGLGASTAATSAAAASTDKVFLRFGGHMPLFFYFLFIHIRYITEHGTVGSHHTKLYDEAGVL
jgi:hypothetical protein